MGKIGDFFRKKAKEEIKKEEKNISKTYKGNYTKEELRKKAASNVLKKAMLRGGIGISCIAAGVTGYNILNNGKENINNNIVAETIGLVQDDNSIKDQTEDISSKIDAIFTKDDALDFIKEMYVTEYNKTNNTKYSIDDIYFISDSSQDYVYDLDGVYLTHGDTPNNVRNKLENENKDYDIKHNVKIYRSYVLVDDKKVPLEKFALIDGRTFDIILGEEYLNGKELTLSENNTLLNMCSVILRGTELVIGFNNGEKESDISLRKYNLEKAALKYQNELSERNEKLDEIGGI